MDLFCSNCGGRTEGAAHCPNCGTACGAEQQAQPQQQPRGGYQQQAQPQGGYQQQAAQGQMPQQPQAPAQPNVHVEAFKSAAKESVPFAKQYIKTPTEATKQVLATDNIALAGVLFLVYCLANALVLMVSYGQITDLVNDLASSASMRLDASTSFLAVLIACVMISLATVLCSSACIFAVCYISNGSADFKKVAIAFTVNTIPLSLCMVVIALCVMMESIKLTFLFYLVQYLLLIVIMVLIPVEVFSSRCNALAYLALCFAILLSGYVTSKVTTSANFYVIERIDTKEGTVGEMLEEAGAELDEILDEIGDLEDIFDDMMYDLGRNLF